MCLFFVLYFSVMLFSFIYCLWKILFIRLTVCCGFFPDFFYTRCSSCALFVDYVCTPNMLKESCGCVCICRVLKNVCIFFCLKFSLIFVCAFLFSPPLFYLSLSSSFSVVFDNFFFLSVHEFFRAIQCFPWCDDPLFHSIKTKLILDCFE